jgi:hypothetical protein
MPISEKRLAANRANAKLSRGPTSVAGKRISSRNGVKNYDISMFILLEGESAPLFKELLRSYEEEFQPATPTERSFVESMVIAQWNQGRVQSLQAAAINYEIRNQCQTENDQSDATPCNRAMHAFRRAATGSPNLELLSREAARFDRQYNRALRSLLKFRAEKQKISANSHQPEETKEIGQ